MTVGGDIKEYLLQRAPILSVDILTDVSGDEAHTRLTIRPDNFFLRADGSMEAVGLIEHIAQSASAFAGYKAKLAGIENPPTGFIGEVKNFRCYRRPRLGEVLDTVVQTGAEVNGITLLSGCTRAGDELVAETQMKIFIRKEG